jgi:predicted esterase
MVTVLAPSLRSRSSSWLPRVCVLGGALLATACAEGSASTADAGGLGDDAGLPVILILPPIVFDSGTAVPTPGNGATPGQGGTPTPTPTPGVDAGSSSTPTAPDSGPPAPTGPAGALTPGTTTVTIQAAGQSRTFYLHVPEAAANGQVPLVLALHGDGDTSLNFVETSGLAAASDTDGFVLAAPQGITRDIPVYDNGQVFQTVPQVDWDAYNAIQADGSITSDNNIDVPLLDAIREQLVASGSINQAHMIVYGYSQGGYLSFRYGMSDAANLSCAAVLAAISPLPGTLLVEGAARKTPVALQIGTEDYAYSNAASVIQELQTNGNPVQYTPVQGAGHVPIPGDPMAPLTWCLGQ